MQRINSKAFSPSPWQRGWGEVSIKKYLLSALAVIFISGCKTQATVTKPASPGAQAAPARKELSEQERMTFTYLYYNAAKEKITGNLDKAEELFAQCIRLDVRSDASMYQLAGIFASKKKFNDALFFARGAVNINGQNTWYKLLLAEILQQTGKFNEAAEVYQALVKENPHRIEYYFNLGNALLFAGKTEEAIKVFDKVEEEIGVEKELILQKQRLYLKLGKTDKAAAEIEKLIALNPKDMEAYAVLAEIYLVNNLKEKSLETINRMKKVNPNHPRVHLALAEYYRSNNENEKSFEQLKLAFENPDLDTDVKLRILTSYMPLVEHNPEMLEQGLQLSRTLAETHPREALSHAVYGDFLSIAKKPEEANIEYAKSLEIDDKNERVWQQLILNASERSDFEAMLKASEEAIAIFPNNTTFYLANGIAKSQKKLYEEANSIFLTGSKMVVDDDIRLVDFYSRMGDNYNQVKNYAESDKYYEKALEINPRNAYVLNNYGYYLSLRKEQLDKAAAMSKLSNEITPNQSSFQDTYAWILYKQNKLKDAQQWMEKALASGGDKSGTILEHYGDILFKAGQTEKAMQFWQKAKDAGDASDLIEKKIADKKLYEEPYLKNNEVERVK